MIPQCSFVIIRQNGKFLVLNHVKHQEWSLVGGKRDDNDLYSRDTILREMKEEVISGFKESFINKNELSIDDYIRYNIYFISNFITKWSDDCPLHECLIYFFDDKENAMDFKILEPDRHSDLKWISGEEFNELHPTDVILKYLITIQSVLDQYVEYYYNREES